MALLCHCIEFWSKTVRYPFWSYSRNYNFGRGVGSSACPAKCRRVTGDVVDLMGLIVLVAVAAVVVAVVRSQRTKGQVAVRAEGVGETSKGTLGNSRPVVGWLLFASSIVFLLIGFALRAGSRGTNDVATAFQIAGGVAYVCFWIWVIIAIGNIAQNKGYSKAGFVIFAIILPFVALIVALILQPSQAKQASLAATRMVKCPMCAELIQPDARKCKHCGSDLEST